MYKSFGGGSVPRENSKRRVSAADIEGQLNLRLQDMEDFSAGGAELHRNHSRRSSQSSMVSVTTNIRYALSAAAATLALVCWQGSHALGRC